MTDPVVPNLTTDELVEQFLGLAMLHPEKPPRTQRAQRENQMLIIGFSRAQETLRSLLKTYGLSEATRALAEVRNEQQECPIEGPGGVKVWMAA